MALVPRSGGVSVAMTLAVAMALSPGVVRADSQLDRGDYLMNGVIACGNCHTPKGPDGRALADQELSGGLVIDAPAFHAVAPNITPDDATGIGRWTDEQLVNAIRNGKRPDGTTIGPPMPIPFYRNMSDTDVRAIVAYMRSVTPISRKVEKSSYQIPLPDSYGPPVTDVADVPGGNKVEHGRYLAEIGHCMECHTPMVNGQLDLARIGSGGREIAAFPAGVATTANLTPANPDGMARWTDAQVKDTITGGVRPDGRRLVLLMAFDWYKNISPDDLDDLVAYLRTLKPATP
jgi:mono/diheme cytochrome c family protein